MTGTVEAAGVEAPRARPAEPDPGRRRPGGLVAWFLVLALPLGLFLVFAVPPMQGLDEPNHLLRVWSLTDGDLVPPTVHAGTRSVVIDGRAATVPAGTVRRGTSAKAVVVAPCLYAYITDNYDQALRAGPMGTTPFFRTPPGCARSPDTLVVYDNTAINSPVTYLPQVAAVGVLRAAGAPLPVVFYGGRLAGLLAYVLLVALALRAAPRGRGVLFVVGLLPMSLEGAATYSADTMTLALALMVVALTVRLVVDPRAGWRWFGALALSCWLLALTKEPYFLLGFLVLLVPGSRLARGGHHLGPAAVRAARWGVVAVTLLLAGGWYLLAVRGVTLQADYPPGMVDQGAMVRFALHHPWSFTGLVGRSVLVRSGQGGVALGMVSSIGFFRNQGSSAFPPVALGLLAAATLFVAYRQEAGARLARASGWTARLAPWLPAAVTALGALAVYVGAALRSTAPGAHLINGVQGRYLLPLVPVPVVGVVLWRAPSTRRPAHRWLVAAMAVLAASTVAEVFVRFY